MVHTILLVVAFVLFLLAAFGVQRARIQARIMEQCECAQIGVRPCGACEG